MKLTQTQQAVISDIAQSLLVTAPAGAGKTEVMARRAAHALKSGKTNILCLTFTNRAANSMKKRIRTLTDGNKNITVCTLHAFCNMLIRAESKSLGLPYGFSIMDEEDASAIIKHILKQSERDFSEHDIKATVSLLEDYRLSKALNRGLSDGLTERFSARTGLALETVLSQYLSALSSSGALDFFALITTAYTFLSDKDNLIRWQQVYDFIQIDEMQDTGIIEYEMIKGLASGHHNLSLFGDTDQTIYEWRDSRPFEIIDDFKKTFQPKEYVLTHNFRSTGHITACAETFLSRFFETQEKEIVVNSGAGEKPRLCFLNNPVYEKKQINRIIQKLHDDHTPYSEIAVLTRTNKDARDYSHALADAGIPCYIIDEYNFFRREEIKDALSVLKLVLNPRDTASARRVLTKFVPNIGQKTVSDIIACPLPVMLSDFISLSYVEDTDILSPVLTPFFEDSIVVFDVESTGLDTESDEIIEIAAVKFGISGTAERFHAYIKNEKPVGASQAIHGYSDDFLAKNGKSAQEVLTEFLDFAKGCVLCGHNVVYDITILKSELNRLNIPFKFPDIYIDTLDSAKRVLKDADDYKLGTLCTHFEIEETPTHHAMDDVIATCHLLNETNMMLEDTAEQRESFYQQYRDKFHAFSEHIKDLKAQVESLRPDVILKTAVEMLDIKSHYKNFPSKQENLDELVDIFKHLDDPELSPETSLRRITELLTLSNTTERQIGDANRVAVLTVHQAKGLQFDAVIIANAVEGAYPSAMNIKYNQFDEEARLFYVAMTRASKHLFVTLSAEDDHGRKNTSSRFLKYLPKEHYEISVQNKT